MKPFLILWSFAGLFSFQIASAAQEQSPTESSPANTPNRQVLSLEDIRLTIQAREKTGRARVVHLAVRTDGIAGTGSEADPYDASSAARFDALMAAFYDLFAEQALTIVLGPGVFQTNARDSYGPNVGRNLGAQHWLHANWTLRGSGMFATEIRNVNQNTNGVTMFNSIGGTWGGGKEEGNITVEELTLNPQKSAFSDGEASEAIAIAGDGTTATGTKTAHGLTIGTEIRIAKATNARFNGVFILTAVTKDTFSFSNETIGAATATVQRSGQWTVVRLNGGRLRLHRVRAIDCGSSAPETECWPLWLGSGDGNLIDEGVVENCSGYISAIAIFPGTHSMVRNSRVDATGCAGCLGISGASGVVTGNYIKSANYAIYADTFANGEGTIITNNIIDSPADGGIYLRPNDHHRGIIIANNVVTGGHASIGIGINPLTNNTRQNPKTWLNARREKIWIDDVTVTNNSVGEKLLVFGQIRGLKVVDNTAGGGHFFSMKGQSRVCRGNRTCLGEIPVGLHNRRTSSRD
ncbi:MAG: right-handed parallel beta-helix repeat-containing protein [Chthoniobacterales bacterium]